jgi:conjugal transfer pilus assembly protein TraK
MMRKIAVVAALLTPVLVQAAEIEGEAKPNPMLDQVVEQPAEGEFPAIVLPETTTRVRLSSSDLNRISCQADIREVLTSTEKGLTIKITGKDAFVKFKVAKKGDKLAYAATPTELYAVCGDETFSMIAFPQRIPSQTIRLSSGRTSKIRENRSLYAGLPFEKKVLKALKEVYTENIPDSYIITNKEKRVTSFREILLTLKRTVDIEGEGLRIKEYEAAPQGETTPFKMNEKMFLRPEVTDNPVAIALERHLLRQGDTSRVFVVEQRAEKLETRKLAGELPVMAGTRPNVAANPVSGVKDRAVPQPEAASQETDDEK